MNRRKMNRSYKAAFALATSFMMAASAPALAAPPTATPSPGYDARLTESRKAAATTSTVVDTARLPAARSPRHHRKSKH